jgi:hypothetical protein
MDKIWDFDLFLDLFQAFIFESLILILELLGIKRFDPGALLLKFLCVEPSPFFS